MAEEKELISVEVAFALPKHQEIIALKVKKGCVASEAVKLSGISEIFREVDFENAPKGIFSRLMDGVQLPLPENYVLKEKDRVEIYRPLIIDPKQARFQRALNKKSG